MQDETTPQDSAAMPPASTGSVDAPVAWLVTGGDYEYATIFKDRAAAWVESDGKGRVVPLYRSPALSATEQQAIADAISCCEDITYGGAANQEAADVLKALLERLK